MGLDSFKRPEANTGKVQLMMNDAGERWYTDPVSGKAVTLDEEANDYLNKRQADASLPKDPKYPDFNDRLSFGERPGEGGEEPQKSPEDIKREADEKTSGLLKIPIPGPDGKQIGEAYYREADDSMLVRKGDNVYVIASGGYDTFTKDGESYTKKWQGGSNGGWTDVSEEELQKIRDERAAQQEKGRKDRGEDGKSVGVDSKAVAKKEKKFDPLKKRVPPPKEREPLKDAPGIYAGVAGISYEVRDGKRFVREGKAVRFATPDDEAAFKVAMEASEKVRTSKPEPGGSLEKKMGTTSNSEAMPSAVRSPYAVEAPQFPYLWMAPRKDMVPQFIRDSQAALPEDPSLQQVPDMRTIMGNKAMNDALARLAVNFDGAAGAELLNKFYSSPEDPSIDWMRLDGYRYQLQRRMLALEEAQENISDEDIGYMLQNAPGMRLISTNLGSDPERMKAIVKSHLSNVWMSLPEEQFNRFSEAVKANRDIRRSQAYKQLGSTVQQRVSDPRANPQNVNWREAAASRALEPRDERGWWRRNLDKLFGSEKIVQAERARTAAGNLEMLQAQEANRNNIMTILAATIDADPALRRRVVQEAVSGRAQAPAQLGENVADASEYSAMALKFYEHDAIAARITAPAFRAAIADRTKKAWNELSRQQREEASYALLLEEGLLPPVPGGGVAGIAMRASFVLYFDYMRSELHKRRVFEPVP